MSKAGDLAQKQGLRDGYLGSDVGIRAKNGEEQTSGVLDKEGGGDGKADSQGERDLGERRGSSSWS